MLSPPGGESILGWLDPYTLLCVQLTVNMLVVAGLWYAASRLGGFVAGQAAIFWWAAWPTPMAAASMPYYYFWPIPFSVGLACVWVRWGATRWTTPLMIAWAQFRATALGPMVVTRHWLAIVVTLLLTVAGHGRTQVWHDLLTGIGTRPNPYGIEHRDQWAIDFAAARGVEFKSPAYEPLLRREYLRIARENPGLLARNTALNTVDAARGWSFWGGKYHLFDWVPILVLWTAWRDRATYRALTLVWLSQCATLGFVGRPQECYLWETAGLFVLLGSVGIGRLLASSDRV